MGQESKKKVLLITASVGGGHNQAAAAIAESLDNVDCSVEKIDIMDYLPLWFRSYYGGGYSLLVSRLSWLYGLGFWYSDRPDTPKRTFGEKNRIAIERLAAEKLIDRVEDIAPDLIINTHFLAPPILGQMGYENQFVVVTDILSHRWWYAENINHWFVQQPKSAERLIQSWKIPPDKITISGMPVRKTFAKPCGDTPQLRDSLHLPRDRRIILLSGGTEFTCGPIVQIARDLSATADDVCVVALAGRNKKLLGSLSVLPETQAGKILPMGFTDRVSDLMSTAEFIITKPGGMICAECLAKALPAIFLKPVPGQELHNARFLQDCGAAIIAEKNSLLPSIASNLLEDAPKLQAMSEKSAALHRPATDMITKAVEEFLFNKTTE